MVKRDQLEEAVALALKDPELATGERAFRAAVAAALRRELSLAPEVAAAIAGELIISEPLRRGLLQNELLRVGMAQGIGDRRELLCRVGDELFREITAMRSHEEMREKIVQALVAGKIADDRQAKRIAMNLSLELILPAVAGLETAAAPLKMQDQELREELFKMAIETMRGSLPRERAHQQAEEFVLLLLGPSEEEGTVDTMPSLLSVMSSNIALLLKYADNPEKRDKVIAAIEELMAEHARPNIDTFLFIKMLNMHGICFLETIQEALINGAGSAGKELAAQINLQI